MGGGGKWKKGKTGRGLSKVTEESRPRHFLRGDYLRKLIEVKIEFNNRRTQPSTDAHILSNRFVGKQQTQIT